MVPRHCPELLQTSPVVQERRSSQAKPLLGVWVQAKPDALIEEGVQASTVQTFLSSQFCGR
jgi:hypothetical protein